ncbi:MAG: hypothetical protein MJ177_06210 [Clostridia bacterium]|nr:hypothetical protein [Clostridia bacterium]
MTHENCGIIQTAKRVSKKSESKSVTVQQQVRQQRGNSAATARQQRGRTVTVKCYKALQSQNR